MIFSRRNEAPTVDLVMNAMNSDSDILDIVREKEGLILFFRRRQCGVFCAVL